MSSDGRKRPPWLHSVPPSVPQFGAHADYHVALDELTLAQTELLERVLRRVRAAFPDERLWRALLRQLSDATAVDLPAVSHVPHRLPWYCRQVVELLDEQLTDEGSVIALALARRMKEICWVLRAAADGSFRYGRGLAQSTQHILEAASAIRKIRF
jgi:hypothetical protein